MSAIMNFLMVTLLALPPAHSYGYFQSIEVRGEIRCNGVPVPGQTVQLWEQDILFHDLLEETSTDDGGNFSLWGMDKEFTEIDPYIFVIGECPAESECYREIKSKVPKGHVTWHRKPPVHFFDVGLLELADGIETLDSPVDACHYAEMISS